MFPELLIFFVAGLAIVVILKKFFAWQQSSLAGKQFRKFNFSAEQKIPVQYTFTAYGSLSMTAGFPIKADMYLRDNFIFLAPGRHRFWNGIINFLPVVFAPDKKSVKALTTIDNVFVPEVFSLFGKQSIRIRYYRDFPYKRKIDVIVKVLDKGKIHELDKLKNWSFNCANFP